MVSPFRMCVCFRLGKLREYKPKQKQVEPKQVERYIQGLLQGLLVFVYGARIQITSPQSQQLPNCWLVTM